ncbi:MAG TPA: hypothetical protein VGG39_23865 [Polyangiaceae bacterium]|jgi:hypothetical protein
MSETGATSEASDATRGGWRAEKHGPLEKVADNLWRVAGDVPGMSLKRVMVVVRLSDGRLLVHGAIAMRDDAMKELEALGEPGVLVVPSGYHRMDAPRYKARYPKMRVYCPYGARARVAKVVPVDGVYEDFPGDPAATLDHVDGIGDREGVVRVTSSDGVTLVFNDVLFNMPHGALVFRLLGASGGLRVSRTARFFLLQDPRALARRFVALAATPRLVRIMVAHVDTVERGAADALRQVALTI